MVKWVRDFNELSKPKKIIVGLVGSAIGVIFSILAGMEIGMSINTTIQNVVISSLLGIAAAYIYGYFNKKGAKVQT